MEQNFFDLENIAVVDVETDALTDYSLVHCVVVSDLKGNSDAYVQPSRRVSQRVALQERLKNVRTVVGHNFIGFDYDALCSLLPGVLTPEHRVLDTLVLSRLLNYNIPGGHSIDAWGKRLGVLKKHSGLQDFSVFSPEMLERCFSDVAVNLAMVKDKFWRFLTDKSWHSSILTEHEVAWMCREMHKNGLPFHKEGAERLKEILEEKLAPLDEALHTAFPPREKLIRRVTPRLTKKGTLNAQDFRWAGNREFTYDRSRSVVVLGDPVDNPTLDLSAFDESAFDLVELEPFNPGSPRQIVERLNDAGWKPTDKTKGHIEALKNRRKLPKEKLDEYARFGWKVSEENLKTLPDTAPQAAKDLAKRLTIASRLSDLDEWLALVHPDGKLHPYFSSIGAWTHRLSHSKPNSANIPVGHKEADWMTEFEKFVNQINNEMRALFYAPKGYRLIGTDADGIQMRIFAHLVGDPKLIEALINGRKEDKTDIHSVHQGALGDVCKSRDHAKTFIYAWLLGAGTAKVAEILECTQPQAKAAVASFLEFYPGLKELKRSRIPEDAARGYFIGLDGRKVACTSEHLMLSGYLQNGEKVIMARAGVQWKRELTNRGIPFTLLNWVHDEWQTLVLDYDNLCEEVQKIQIQAIRDQAEQLKMLCPLEGSSDWGYSWKDTH